MRAHRAVPARTRLRAVLAAFVLIASAGTAMVMGHRTDAAIPGIRPPVTRTYFVAADPVDWDYAPDGAAPVTGLPPRPPEAGPAVYTQPARNRIGHVFRKSLFRAYTDDTFATLEARPPQWQHLGFLGPVLRAEVGDTIKVVFRNNLPWKASMHPHGVAYDPASEGVPRGDDPSDPPAGVAGPGQTITYTWRVPDRAGPGPMEGSSTMWMYHSHVDEPVDVDAGLMGPIIVTRRGMARPDGSPIDVDNELVASFFTDDENRSPWLDTNITRSLPAGVDKTDPGFMRANRKSTINGYIYGNGPSFTLRQNERSRWYLMSMGGEHDLHTPHWHGNTATAGGMRTDTVALSPATMVTADMRPDNPGAWLFHCHVAEHLEAGMVTLYRVT
jgi:FtsP/CotA-like multicopper oxidase with cupredoxin domain